MAEDIHLAIQKHEALRAGLHYDWRIVLGSKAFSWATRKPMPKPGEKLILWQQPVHTAHYAFQKHIEIPAGQYGGGVTTLDYVQRGKGEVGMDYYRLQLNNGDKFTIKKMPQFGDKAWMLINVSNSKNWKPLDHEKEHHPELLKRKLKEANIELKSALAAGRVGDTMQKEANATETCTERLNRRSDAILRGQGFRSEITPVITGSATDWVGRKVGIPQRMQQAIDTSFTPEQAAMLKLRMAVSKAHEAYETIYTNRNAKVEVVKRDPRPSDEERAKLTKALIVDKAGKITGKHANLGVLGREANDVLALPDGPVKGHRIIVRMENGEAQLLYKVTGKRYGFDKFTAEDLKKLEEYPTNGEATLNNVLYKAYRID